MCYGTLKKKKNAKYTPALHCIPGFEGTSYGKLLDTVSSFISCCFTSAFASADIFIELYLIVSEKKGLSPKVFLFNGFT